MEARNAKATAPRRSATDGVVGEQEKKTQVYDIRSVRRKKPAHAVRVSVPEARFIFLSPSPPRPPSCSPSKRSWALYIVLTARGLNPQLKIIARASEDDAEKHLLTAGTDSVVSPYHFAGQRIAQSFLCPHVVSFLDTATTHLGIDLEIGEI